MVDSDARFSRCRTWRYSLTRKWTALPLLGFIGLNPSTADETTDDPTIRRCIGFARDWGFGGIVMLNLFAYRSTDPRKLRDIPYNMAVGPECDDVILTESMRCERIVCAWGCHGRLHSRGEEVVNIFRIPENVFCLGKTQGGFPKHPLYLRKNTELEPFGRM